MSNVLTYSSSTFRRSSKKLICNLFLNRDLDKDKEIKGILWMLVQFLRQTWLANITSEQELTQCFSVTSNQLDEQWPIQLDKISFYCYTSPPPQPFQYSWIPHLQKDMSFFVCFVQAWLVAAMDSCFNGLFRPHQHGIRV